MKRAILFSLIIFVIPQMAMAQTGWDDCPRGRQCSYPGICRFYIDTNSDNLCDLGQSEPVAVSTIPSQDSSPVDIKAPDEPQPSGETGQVTGISNLENTNSKNNGNHRGDLYHLIPTLLIIASLYLLTFILARMRFINEADHRKIWNVLLLVSFLGSAVLGLVLLIQVDFDADISLPFNILYWHVEFSIAMGLISIFHIIWHWKYFVKLLK